MNINKSILDILSRNLWVFDNSKNNIDDTDTSRSKARIIVAQYQLIVKDSKDKIVFFSDYETLGITIYDNNKLMFFNSLNDSEVELFKCNDVIEKDDYLSQNAEKRGNWILENSSGIKNN
jgi:hypothetical protein